VVTQLITETRLRRNHYAILIGIVVGLIAVIFVIVPDFLFIFSPHYHGTVYWDMPPARDFELPRADGGTWRLSAYRGQIIALYFGYTNCPDDCPLTLSNLSQMMRQLSERSRQVTVVFVTVDPKGDTAERLKTYLEAFNPAFVGLLGTPEQLQPVYDQYNVKIFNADQGEAVTSAGIRHSNSLFLLDRRGRLRVQLHIGDTWRGILSDVENLLNEPSW
jgi:protein SCO1/2